jgi:hypothetical protein
MNERSVPLAKPGVDSQRVIVIAAAVLVFLGASMGMLALVFFTVVPGNLAPTPRQLPQPELQAHPGADLQQLLARQRSEISQYRWASPDHALVAIPVERAMEIVAERGPQGYAPIVAAPVTAVPRPAAKP